MSLRFILGRAGTGKTHACLEAIRSELLMRPDGPPLVLLVPEQATFQMEQALLRSGDVSGMIRAQVLSFQRLAWRVSLQAGGLALPPLSDLGKRMVLRALLERRQDQLRLFGKVADQPGFIEKLAATISELRSYHLSPAGLQRHLQAMAGEGGVETVLDAKVHDLSLVMHDLTEYTAGRFTDPDDYLTVLAERLPASGVMDGAEVWVDSFTGFTPQEFSVLGALFRSARRTHVTLCADPREIPMGRGRRDPAKLFHPTLTTHDQISALARDAGVPLEPPFLPVPADKSAPRFGDNWELIYVERGLFDVRMPVWKGPSPALALVQASNRREEVEAAAREVLRLVREGGLRFREVSVVARNLDAYGDLAAAVFADHGIPAFVDRRRTVAHHPLVELLRAALEAVIQDWAYAPVFRYLKTDLTAVQRGEVDALENYVLAHGIRGRSWHEPEGEGWKFLRRYTLESETEPSANDAEYLARVNRMRLRAAAELAAFHRRVSVGRGRKGGLTLRTVSAALFALLEDLKAARRLEQWSASAEAAGNLEGAREHEQVWDGVMELLDQMVESLGDVPMSLTQYLQVLTAGLDGLRLGLIPPGMDQVLVGSSERSRHSGVRATLIVGATEKDFPPQPPEDVIFTDREREHLDREGLELGPTSRTRLFQEQFFTYIALTRGSDRLWISYPLADDAGRAVAPSPVLRRLRQLFPDLRPQPAASPAGAASPDAIATPAYLAAGLARALRLRRGGAAIDPLWLDLYQWAATDAGLRARVAPVMAALRYEEGWREKNTPLGGPLAVTLYGQTLLTSVTRMESFAACPFQHFAGHGLALRERDRFELGALELGLIYHAALSLFVRELNAEGRSWADLDPAEAALRLDRQVDVLAPRLQSEILLSSAQNRYLLSVIRRTLRSSLSFLGEHVYQGSFRPLWVEMPFGSSEGGLPPVVVPVPGGGEVRLQGRIDRVDTMPGPGPGTHYLRVMDYKSSPRGLDLGQFYHGLSLQLLLYLQAAVQGADLLREGTYLPAGALYFPVHDPLPLLERPESAERVRELRRRQYTATGLVGGDPDLVRAMDPTGLGLIKAKLRQDGTLHKRSSVADPAQFEQAFSHLRGVIGRSASRLLAGDLSAAPYRLGKKTPCQLCRYRAVCQFDPTVAGQAYRTLEGLKGPEVWERLSRGGESDE